MVISYAVLRNKKNNNVHCQGKELPELTCVSEEEGGTAVEVLSSTTSIFLDKPINVSFL